MPSTLRRVIRLALPFMGCLALSSVSACGNLGTDREPVVAPHEHRADAVVQLRRASLPQPLSAMAVHYWFAAWDADFRVWERWEVWQQKGLTTTSWGYVHRDLSAIDAPVGGGESVVERQWYGDEARALIAALHASPLYPHRDLYRAWPGPNSNTYVAWVLREAGVAADLDPKAIGKDWRGWIGAGATTTGTGVQLSTPLTGLKLGARDGFEVSVLCLTFGFKPSPPALKTPFGSLGAPEQ
jgi:hypothetical protein